MGRLQRFIKKFINAVASGEAETEKQIHVIAEELANRSAIDKKSKKLLALSVESVILERMGMSSENATRQLARLSSENVSEENSSTTTESTNSESVEEIPVPDTASEVVENTPIDTVADEQNNADYDFDEMDKEGEIPYQLAITGGIGETLIATATELCVSIFALVVHTYFAQKLYENLTKIG